MSRTVAADRAVALATLLQRIDPLAVVGDRDRAVRAVEIDSRRVRPGALFVALRGDRTDGHRYVRDAIANGARAVVLESPEDLPEDVTVVRVADSRRALSALAAAFYGDPSHSLDVTGVTGTNGKTTVTHMAAAILNAAGIPCGVVGTVGAEFGSRSWRSEHTTPQPPELHALLAEMRDARAKAVTMEVSFCISVAREY